MERLEKKVCDLFAARFGIELVINWLAAKDQHARMTKNWQTTFVYSLTRQQVSFPILNSAKQLKAIAVASPVTNDDVVNFKDMEDFIQLTISEALALEERISRIERTEEAMNLANNQPSNVLRWPKKNDGERGKMAILRRQNNLLGVEGALDPIWVYGEDPRFCARIAIDAHDWIKNWAFFNVQELPDLFWQKQDPWSKLAQSTIYIPRVETLTNEQWEILRDNLQALKKLRTEKPLIIVGSSKSPEEVKGDLRWLFKAYQYQEHLNTKSQAHFALFQFRQEKPWVFTSCLLKGLSYLPFGRSSELLH